MEQKLDSELSLALSLPEEERMRNAVLRSGYDPGSRIWTLLLLYHGSLDEIEAALPVSIVPLLGSYAVIRIPAEKIPALLAFPQVLYLELSRPLYEEAITGIAESCMDTVLPVRPGPGGSLTTGDSLATGEGGGTLTGRGTAIAILDSGVDYRHPDFCTADGATRILTYWDQTLDYDGMNRYCAGRRIQHQKRHFHGRSLCERRRLPAHGIRHRSGAGPFPVRRKNKGPAPERSKASACVLRISQPFRGMGRSLS